MARAVTPLTNIKIKNSKAKDKDYKLSDGRGLYLLISKGGGKHWKLKYTFENKEQKLSIGSYPDISLVQAREKRELYKSQIANGINPSQQKKIQKVQYVQAFKAYNDQLERDYFKNFEAGFKYYTKVRIQISNNNCMKCSIFKHTEQKEFISIEEIENAIYNLDFGELLNDNVEQLSPKQEKQIARYKKLNKDGLNNNNIINLVSSDAELENYHRHLELIVKGLYKELNKISRGYKRLKKRSNTFTKTD